MNSSRSGWKPVPAADEEHSLHRLLKLSHELGPASPVGGDDTECPWQGTNRAFLTSSGEAALSAAADAPPDDEIKKYYATTLNGNVIFVTTAKDEASLNPAAKDVLQKAVVLMGAITTALGDKASLYDFDIYDTVISKSVYFMPLDLQDSNFHAGSTTVTLDLAIIAEVVGMAGETLTLVSTPCVKVAAQAPEYTALIKTLSGLIPAPAPAPAPAA
jgi:hypothetical protein